MKERMIAGEYFTSTDPTIQKEWQKAVSLCNKYNKIDPIDRKAKAEVLKELFGYETDAIFQDNFHCEIGYNIKLGKRCFFNFNCTMLDVCPIIFGDDVLVGPSVTFIASTHPSSISQRKAGIEFGKPIKVGDHVWIGANATIMPGVTIGKNSVVGAGSVVLHDVPPNTVVVGTPARVVKHLDENEKVNVEDYFK